MTIFTSAQVFSDSTDIKILVPSPFKGKVLSCSIFSTILSPEPVTLKQSSEKSLKIYLLIYIHMKSIHKSTSIKKKTYIEKCCHVICKFCLHIRDSRCIVGEIKYGGTHIEVEETNKCLWTMSKASTWTSGSCNQRINGYFWWRK